MPACRSRTRAATGRSTWSRRISSTRPAPAYSFDVADLLNSAGYNYDANGDAVFPRDAADDNYNAFDVWPVRTTGEIGDTDLYDSAGALVLPVERMRRFVTPADINGTGRVQTWGSSRDYGPDNFGRVQFSSYFRPAGSAGQINITTPFPLAATPTTPTSTGSEYPYGAITPGSNGPYSTWSSGVPTALVAGSTYIPDVTNNVLHGYEQYKIPNRFQVPGATPPYLGTINYTPSGIGGMPIDQYALSSTTYGGSMTGGMPGLPATGFTPPNGVPTEVSTYDNKVNSSNRLDGVNEADEMNLYSLNPLLDSPYGPADLEWLYRQQDVDGSGLTSRLSQLAPVSFTNTIDGQRRRRLFALQGWETNSFAWANDNPGGSFGNNAWFTQGQSPTTAVLSGRMGYNTNTPLATPALAHRDRKINLNLPPAGLQRLQRADPPAVDQRHLPAAEADPPPRLDRHPRGAAQLSQYVINIIDFRDPDATMTHWVNPDITITPGFQSANTTGDGTPVYTYPTLTFNATGQGNLDQFGMEYNPVAINEVLAYSFQSRAPTTSTATWTNRVFIELVNTLTAAYNPSYDYTGVNPGPPATVNPQNYYGYGPSNTNGNNNNSATPPYANPDATAPPMQASTLDLGGFTYLLE